MHITVAAAVAGITSCTIAILGEILGSYIKCRINGEKFRVNPKRVGVFGLYGLLVTGTQ